MYVHDSDHDNNKWYVKLINDKQKSQWVYIFALKAV